MKNTAIKSNRPNAAVPPMSFSESAVERCTAASLRDLGVPFTKVPSFGTGVLEAIQAAGFKTRSLTPDVTVKRFVKEHPAGKFYLATSGHAMALVDGVLTDTEDRGADNRRVYFAAEIRFSLKEVA